jgi:hypothetical protein
MLLFFSHFFLSDLIPSKTEKLKNYMYNNFALYRSAGKDLALQFFLKAGLDATTVLSIFQLSDDDRDGRLSCKEFCVAFHLIVCIRYVALVVMMVVMMRCCICLVHLCEDIIYLYLPINFDCLGSLRDIFSCFFLFIIIIIIIFFSLMVLLFSNTQNLEKTTTVSEICPCPTGCPRLCSCLSAPLP